MEKFSGGKWYPGKMFGGKEKQEEKRGGAEAGLARAQQQLQQQEYQSSASVAELAEANNQLAAWQGKVCAAGCACRAPAV